MERSTGGFQPLSLIQATVPTAAERTGDFSQSLDQNNRLITITDPTTQQPFPGNISARQPHQSQRPGSAECSTVA